MNSPLETLTITRDSLSTITGTETTTTPAQASSVEITQNAKGLPQVCVKVYDVDPDAAAELALAIYHRLCAALQEG